MAARRLPSEDATRAPPDHAHRAAGALRQLEEPLRRAFEDGCGRPEVLTQPPAVARVAERAQEGAERAGRSISHAEGWQHEHGVAVAPLLRQQQWPRREEEAELRPRAHLQCEQRERWCTGHRILVDRCHYEERTG